MPDLMEGAHGVLLLLEDDANDQVLFQELIKELGNSVPPLKITDRCSEAETILSSETVIACFVDLRLGEESGLDFIEKNAAAYPDIPFMLITGKGGALVDEKALNVGAKDYLKKGEITSEQVFRSLRYALSDCKHQAFIRGQRDQVHHLLNSMGEVLWIYNIPLGVFEEVGEGIEALTGFPPEEFFKRPELWMELVKESHRIKRSGMFKGITKNDLHEIDYEIHDRQGNAHKVRERVKRMVGNEGADILVGVSRDVTEEDKSLGELKLLQEVFLQLRDAVLITDANVGDPEGPDIKFANPAFLQMTGYSLEELLGKSPKILQGPKTDKEVLFRLKKALLKGEDFRGEAVNYRKDGTEYIVNWGIAPVRNADGEIKYFASIQRDITIERLKEHEEQRDQRLESLGTLVGGVAHDLNNIISPILMGAEMLELVDDPEQRISISKSIAASAQRAAGVVGKLLSFAKGKDSQKEYVSLSSVIHEVYNIATETFPKNLEIRLNISDDLWVTYCDTTEIQQVLLNLCINAKDSMEKEKKGVLTLSAENRKIESDEKSVFLLEEEGPYICLKITDTGTGIPPENLEKIYDPFFTTKKEGKGTGLGLASSLGIINRHHGNIQVESEPGVGTSFSMYLHGYPSYQLHEHEQTKGFAQGKGQRIMVVDDEPMICDIVCDILQKNGYKTQGLSSSTEAVKLFSSESQSFDAVLSDMIMPYVDGLELLKHLRKVRPDIPFLVMSGYTHHDKIDELKAEGITNIIPKPIHLEKLMQEINVLFQE